MRTFISMFFISLLFSCFFKSEPLLYNSSSEPSSEAVQDTMQHPNPKNYSAFIDSLRPAIKILQDAGLPCSVSFEVLVDETGKYLEHKWIGDTCHPLAEKAIEKYMPVLNFTPGEIRGIKQKMWTKMNVNWATW